ncbi:MAG: hypothetical protein LUD52_00345 [Opitutae bacterium]|nr:hypothetical protein [Opitutae bacterium]
MSAKTNSPTSAEEADPKAAQGANTPATASDSKDNEVNDDEVSLDPLKRNSKFSWKNFGGESFVISILFHLVLLVIAVFLVVRHIQNKVEEDPPSFVSGSGGGNSGERANMQEHRMKPRNAQNMVKSKNKIMSKSTTSTLVLPETPQMNMNTSFGSAGMSAGGDSSGFGGGSGGGIGTGKGMGVGNGRNFVSGFGSRLKRDDALKGTLFDLKRTPNGTVLATTAGSGGEKKKRNEQLHSALGMLDKKWDLASLKKKYFAAPTTLYTTSIFIVDKNGNALSATRATEAFADENGQKPFDAPGWLCYYEGYFSVPESGEYRFVGMGDDAMIVGVNKKTALYAFWPNEGHGPAVRFVKGWEPENFCGAGGNDGKAMVAGAGQRSTLYKGGWFNMKAGQRYRIQVAFGEAAGGLGGATLGIQKKDRDTDDNFPMFTLEAMDPDPAIKIADTGKYNTSTVFRPAKK